MLPTGIAGVDFSQTLENSQAIAVGLECVEQIALGEENVANPLIRNQKRARAQRPHGYSKRLKCVVTCSSV